MKKEHTTPQRWMLWAARQAGDLVQLSATYLGIVLLALAASSVMVPSVRDQMALAAEAALRALMPDSDVPALQGLARTFADAPDDAPNDAPVADGATDAGSSASAASVGAASSSAPDAALNFDDVRRDFDRFLIENPDALAVDGVSGTQFQSLRRYLARRYRVAQNVAGALIQTAHTLGQSRGVDPQLLLAIIAIESRYNPFAESHVGAQGLMQVMPRVHRDKFEALGLDIATAVEPVANMMVGTQIYADCRRRRGSVAGALACYVGATGPGDGGYGVKVLAERRRIARAMGTAPMAD